MKNVFLMIFIILAFTLTGCGTSNTNSVSPTATPDITESPKATSTPAPTAVIDIKKIKPNENGKVMVLMFHNFISEYKKGDKEYTTTFFAFQNLLDKLYKLDFRPVSVSDYLNNKIDLPAGKIPVVFTFDDGTKGQFNLVKSGETLSASPDSAVGVMEKFNKQHPDFNLRGTFFVNMESSPFQGEGTLSERFEYLYKEGFDIGNHTYSHKLLRTVKSSVKLQEELGKNNKEFNEKYSQGFMNSLALPNGVYPPKSIRQYLMHGTFEGMNYTNLGVFLVGAEPAYSSIDKRFKATGISRVRATGISPVTCDSDWWIKNTSKKSLYVSDGDIHTITVPKVKAVNVDQSKLGDIKLITY